MRPLLLLLLLLLAGPGFTADWFAPDAALLGQTLNAGGETIEGGSWVLGSVLGRRCWADLIEPQGDPWLGLSADLTAGGIPCAGAGFDFAAEEVKLYIGAHVSF